MKIKNQKTRYGEAIKLFFENEGEYENLINDLEDIKKIINDSHKDISNINMIINDIKARYITSDETGSEPTSIIFQNRSSIIFFTLLDLYVGYLSKSNALYTENIESLKQQENLYKELCQLIERSCQLNERSCHLCDEARADLEDYRNAYEASKEMNKLYAALTEALLSIIQNIDFHDELTSSELPEISTAITELNECVNAW